MVAVIPLLNRSRNNYIELRYALRSFEKHLGVNSCILVGGLPEWYNGDRIPYPDANSMLTKERNIFDKLKAGAELVKEFLFANDDHYVFTPYWGLHHKGLLSECAKVKHGSYGRTLRNTIDAFGDVENYDTHCPMIMTAEQVNNVRVNWGVPCGVGVKSSVVHSNGLKGSYYPDMKVRAIPDKIDRHYISTTEDVVNINELRKYFPHKSIFEK